MSHIVIAIQNISYTKLFPSLPSFQLKVVLLYYDIGHYTVNQVFVCCFSVDRNKYQIHIPLPPKIDPTVTMMQVEEKPDVTYSDVGGCKEQIEKLREVVETPLLHVSLKF